MIRKLKAYPEAFKRELVALYEAGAGTVSELEREYDVGRTNLYRWIKKYGRAPQGAPAEPESVPGEQARIRELEQEVMRLRQERDILKKAVAIFAQPKQNDSNS